MKFAALVLLLVVGSQAASLPADAPDQAAEFRTKVKEVFDRIFLPLESTSLKESTNKAGQTLDAGLGQAIELSRGFYDQTADMREAAKTKFEEFQKEIAAEVEAVKKNILDHTTEYIAAFTPLKELLESKKDHVEEVMNKGKSVMDDIGGKVPGNWQETKASLMALVQKAREHLEPQREQAKQALEPYFQEFLDNAKKYMENPTAQGASAVEDLKTRLGPYYTTLVESLNKN